MPAGISFANGVAVVSAAESETVWTTAPVGEPWRRSKVNDTGRLAGVVSFLTETVAPLITLVVAVAVLSPVFGSLVVLETVAVLEMTVPAATLAPTWARNLTIVEVCAARVPRDSGLLQALPVAGSQATPMQ